MAFVAEIPSLPACGDRERHLARRSEQYWPASRTSAREPLIKSISSSYVVAHTKISPCISDICEVDIFAQINTDIETGDLPNLTTVQETVALVTGKTVAAPEKAAKPRLLKAEKKEKVEKITKPVFIKALEKEIVERVVERVKYGRPVKPTAVGREKFTTMLQPDLIRLLKRTAIDKAVTVADLLEDLIANGLSVK